MTENVKKQSSIVQAWLIVYNVAMTAGWSIIGIGMTKYLMKHNTYKGLYDHVEEQLLFFQTFAVLEIFHAILGLVRSSVFTTTLQVFSRVGVIWGVLQPVEEVQDRIGFTMLLAAWTITEIIRYLYYTFTLLGYRPKVVVWLRYTLFIVLYPLGVTGELLTIYHSLKPVYDSGLYSLAFPNSLNFAFNYYYVLMGTFPYYVIYFPQLYFHMFAQRRKQLGFQKPPTPSKKLN